MKKKIIISFVSVCLLLSILIIYLLRYQSVHNILGEGFTENFVVHNIWVDSVTQSTPWMSEEELRRTYFHELYATPHDQERYELRSDAFYIITYEQVAMLLELLLNTRIRTYSPTSHPIIFNSRFCSGFNTQETDPGVVVYYRFFDLDMQEYISIRIWGADVITIATGEISEEGFSANSRIGFNPTIFRIHEEDRYLVFEMLRLLDSNAPEVIGFELE